MATAQTIRVPAPELFNPQTGRLDAARIARELNVPVTTIAVAIGRKAPGVRKHPDASSLQSELRRIYRILGDFSGTLRWKQSGSPPVSERTESIPGTPCSD